MSKRCASAWAGLQPFRGGPERPKQSCWESALNEANAAAAAEAAFVRARPREHNAFKVSLGKATLVRALFEAKAMEV